MKPYWQSPDGRITVYRSRWEAVLSAGLVPVEQVSLIHADPVYTPADRPLPGNRRGKTSGGGVDCARLKQRDFPPLAGASRPFRPAKILRLGRPTVLWGANHYGGVPGSPSWILWDKRDGVTPDNGADGELAWTNLGGPLRVFGHLWRGTLRASECGTPHLGPTQKPIALSSYVFARAKLRTGDLVLVPYLGSGPDLPAALAMGLRVIACDVERWCCDTAIGRLGAITPEKAAEPVGPLFTPRPPQ